MFRRCPEFGEGGAILDFEANWRTKQERCSFRMPEHVAEAILTRAASDRYREDRE